MDSQFSKYILTGAITSIINLILYTILTDYIFSPLNAITLQISNVIAWIVTVVIAYILNKNYVFESEEPVWKTLIMFYLSRLFTLLIETFMLWLLITKLGVNNIIGKLVTITVVIILNYIISKFITFKY